LTHASSTKERPNIFRKNLIRTGDQAAQRIVNRQDSLQCHATSSAAGRVNRCRHVTQTAANPKVLHDEYN
jgi:hypothetical protein